MNCRACDTPGPSLLCSRCKSIMYCNKDCQKNDWSDHKRICRKCDDLELEMLEGYEKDLIIEAGF